MIKGKKGDGVFGMSFGMIFSIILIVFFIVAGFIGVKAFLGWQKCAGIGLFFNDLQNEINVAWNANNYGPKAVNISITSDVKYVCFVNFSAPLKNANNIEKEIFKYMKTNYDASNNLYLYAPGKDLCLTWTKINHVDASLRNPLCVKVDNGIASIKIERKFEDKFPRIIS